MDTELKINGLNQVYGVVDKEVTEIVIPNTINVPAINALNDLVKKNEPDFADPIDVYWEISKETEDAF